MSVQFDARGEARFRALIENSSDGVLLVTLLSAVISGTLGYLIYQQMHQASEEVAANLAALDDKEFQQQVAADMESRDRTLIYKMAGAGIGLVVTSASHSGLRSNFAQKTSGVSVAAYGSATDEASGGQQGILSTWPANSTDADLGQGEWIGDPCMCRTSVNGDNRFAYLESGCPLGTGEFGSGSIGYWLKPELSDKKHETGTVGAWTSDGAGACKFYITLSDAPGMDGRFTVFGKVIQGLDVAHTISRRPVVDEVEYRPREPVLIRSATVSGGTP